MSIVFDPNALYSRAEADEMLRTIGISLDGFVEHFGIRTAYRPIICGREMLAIADACGQALCQELREKGKGSAVTVALPTDRGRKAICQGGDPVERFDSLMRKGSLLDKE